MGQPCPKCAANARHVAAAAKATGAKGSHAGAKGAQDKQQKKNKAEPALATASAGVLPDPRAKNLAAMRAQSAKFTELIDIQPTGTVQESLLAMRALLDMELEALRQEIQGERPLSERKPKLQAQIDEVKGKLEKNASKVTALEEELVKVKSFVDSQKARLSKLAGEMQLLEAELEPVDKLGLDSTEQRLHADMQALRLRMAEHRRDKITRAAPSAASSGPLLQLGDATAFTRSEWAEAAYQERKDLEQLDVDELMDDQLDALYGIVGEEGSAELANKRNRMREALKLTRGVSSGTKKGNLKAA